MENINKNIPQSLSNTIVAFTLLVLLSPLFILISLAIKLLSPGPILFWSKRVGQNNELFSMPKFRTMNVNTPQVATHLLKGENHIFPFGSFLRKTSLDEIPQLISIIKGDMVFVGPRPALFNQDDLVELRTRDGVHLLKPGITGWAQVNGRDEISIVKKVEFDKEYLYRKSFFFDFKIILLTIYKVLGRRDVSH